MRDSTPRLDRAVERPPSLALDEQAAIDDRGKWQGVYLLVTTKSGHVDATFARAANKIRKKDVAILCERAAAFAGKTYNPAGEARNSVLIDRKRGRI